MAIFGYSGKPGAGKSYSVIAHAVIPALKAGRVIYHNMVLNEGPLRALAGMGGRLIAFDPEVSAAELVANAPIGALIIIDESVRYWGAGTKVSKVPPAELEFFTKHRHRVGDDGRATDIVIICQDFGSQCASFIRELVEFTYYSVKLSALGMNRRYRLECYQGCIKGDAPSQKRLINKKVTKYDAKIYACYVSHTQSTRGVAGEEIKAEGVSVWRNWKVISAAAAIPIAILLAFLALHSVSAFRDQSIQNAHSPANKGRAVGGAAEHSEASPPTVRPQPGSLPANRGELVAMPSPLWRLAGEIRRNGQRLYIVDGERGSRYVAARDCKLDPAGNRTCVVDGQLVAEWTGPAAPAFQKWFTASASDNAVKSAP